MGRFADAQEGASTMSDVYAQMGERTNPVPQSRQADPAQVPNSAGGFTFTVDDWMQLRRFLILGSTGGTYYISERDLTKSNFDLLIRLAEADPARYVAEVVDVSVNARAPKVQSQIFALAVAASSKNVEARRLAGAALLDVCRTGYHLFTFARYVETMRGWGPVLRRSVGAWYLGRSTNSLAGQVIKYRQRDGWTHADLLRLAHPKAESAERNAVFKWIVDGVPPEFSTPIEGFIKVNEDDVTPDRAASLIDEYGLTWEALPDRLMNEPVVWQAFLDKGIGQTALIRQLPRLTRLGLLSDLSGTGVTVTGMLTDPERLKSGRVHPLSVLVAQRTYAAGEGREGRNWTPSRRIVDALDEAFYLAFGAVEPANKRTMLALDVSGSMGWDTIAGLPITPREGSAAMALVTAATEPSYLTVGFTSGGHGVRGYGRGSALTVLPISPRQRLADAIKAVADLPFGGTDCSLPMRYALDKGLEVDTFVVLTDNETWAGDMHPHVALEKYRQATSIDARLVVVGMTATEFSIADTRDPGMLDVVGLDTATPNIISAFSRGEF